MERFTILISKIKANRPGTGCWAVSVSPGPGLLLTCPCKPGSMEMQFLQL